MSRIHRAVALLPVVAVLAACGSSTTAPNNPTPTTTYYVGGFSSAVATGTFKATVITTPSSEVLANAAARAGVGTAGRVGALESGNSVTIAVTFLNATMLTLTGPLNGGTTFTITDNNTPQDMCSGNIANLLAATCTFLGQSNIQLSGALATLDQAGALTTYCGSETPVAGSPSPGGTLLLGIAGSSSFLTRVAPPNSAVTFYHDNAVAAGVVADTLIGASGDVVTDFFGGTFSTSVASGTHAISGTLVGNWTANSPCTLYTEGLSGGGETPPYYSTAVFTAPVNTTPATQSVLVSPVGIGAVTASLDPNTPASWLTVTVSGSNVLLSAAQQSTPTGGAPLTAKVYVWAQFAKNAPDSIFVTYNVTSGPAPVLSGNNNTLTFTMNQGAAPPASQMDQVSATGGTVPLTQPPTTTYTSPAPPADTGWLTAIIPASVAPGTPVQLTVTPKVPLSGALPAGVYQATIEVTSTTPGVAPVIVYATLNVVSTTACTITNPLVPGTNHATLDPLSVGTWASIPLTFTGNCPGPGGVNWLTSAGSLPAGMMFEPDENVIDGTPTAVGTYTFSLELGGASQPTTLPFAGTVGPVSQACVIGPVPGGLSPGTSGQFYQAGLEPSGFYGSSFANSPASTPPGCVAQGDSTRFYTWTITNNPAWLTFPQGQTTVTGQGGGEVGVTILGTAPAVTVPTTYTFTLRFQAKQPAGAPYDGNTADSGPIAYTLTINP